MIKTQTTPYDSAKYLQTEEDIALYFDVCLEEAGDDIAFIAKALGTIARARENSPAMLHATTVITP